MKQYDECCKFIMESICDNKENVLDVAKRLEWLTRMKALVYKLEKGGAIFNDKILDL